MEEDNVSMLYQLEVKDPNNKNKLSTFVKDSEGCWVSETLSCGDNGNTEERGNEKEDYIGDCKGHEFQENLASDTRDSSSPSFSTDESHNGPEFTVSTANSFLWTSDNNSIGTECLNSDGNSINLDKVGTSTGLNNASGYIHNIHVCMANISP